MKNKPFYNNSKPYKPYSSNTVQQTIRNPNSRRSGNGCLPKILLVVGILIVSVIIWKFFGGHSKNQTKESVHTTVENVNKTESNTNSLEDESQDSIFYYYNLASTEEKVIYNKILEGINNSESSISIDETDLELIDKVIRIIIADHPELFWINGSYRKVIYDDKTQIQFSYIYNPKQIQNRQVKIETNVNKALNGVSNSASEYDKIKYVYEYIIDSVEYVAGCDDNQNLYSALVNHKSVCAGYAKATQYLLQKLGIQTIYLSGRSDGRNGWANHAWNIVRCNGSYYQLDCTFGDSYVDDKLKKIGLRDYNYLCVDDDTMSIDHMWKDFELDVPVCNKDDLRYFKLNKIYSDSYDKTVDNDMKNSIYSGKRVWMWQFSNKSAYQDFIKNNKFKEYISDYLKKSIKFHYLHDDAKRYVVFFY